MLYPIALESSEEDTQRARLRQLSGLLHIFYGILRNALTVPKYSRIMLIGFKYPGEEADMPYSAA